MEIPAKIIADTLIDQIILASIWFEIDRRTNNSGESIKFIVTKDIKMS